MSTHVEAQIAGTVWKIEKAAGDPLLEEDVILILESMKMEIPVEAPADGTVAEVCVALEDQVEEDQLLAVVEA